MASDNIIRDEHDAFQQIIHGLRLAGDAAAQMARFRPDQRDAWLMMANTYKVCASSAYKLAEEAARATIKS